MSSSRRALLPCVALTAAALTLTACSSADTSADASGGASDAALTVGASFYPLQYMAERVGGDLVNVTSLIATGVEPHDAEISPSTVREMQSMDTVIYLSDFSAAVDDAVDTTGVRTVDAHHVVEEHEAEVADYIEHAHEGEESTADDESHEGHDHAGVDPHFWTDPAIYAEFVADVEAEFSELDPDNADTYAANAAALTEELTDLDESFTTGLESCERNEIFVSHEAYAYLAMHHGLIQEGLSGLDPEAEPSPARVREIRDAIAGSGATTLFTESLVSSAVADSLASDLGVTTAVLDPIESAVDGDDYLSIQERNLEALRTGLDCA